MAHESALMAYGEYKSESWNAATSSHTVKTDSPNGREYYQLITGLQMGDRERETHVETETNTERET